MFRTQLTDCVALYSGRRSSSTSPHSSSSGSPRRAAVFGRAGRSPMGSLYDASEVKKKKRQSNVEDERGRETDTDPAPIFTHQRRHGPGCPGSLACLRRRSGCSGTSRPCRALGGLENTRHATRVSNRTPAETATGRRVTKRYPPEALFGCGSLRPDFVRRPLPFRIALAPR